MSTNIKEISITDDSIEEDEENWYTEIGTKEEKEIIEDTDPYYFIN